MKGKHIKFLRERAHISQAEMAQILVVSARTLAKWESNEENMIPLVYTKAYRSCFENLILTPILRSCTHTVFQKIPSEFIGIWLVRHSLFTMQYAPIKFEESLHSTSFWEVILHENTSRYQCLCNSEEEKKKCYWRSFCNGNFFFHNDKTQKNLTQVSQTTYPLHSGKTINLTEDEIVKSPYKRFPGRSNISYHDQICHSLLHVPFHLPHITGPQPVALLSLENRLEKYDNDLWRVKTFPRGTIGAAFTEEDEHTAKDLIRNIYEQEFKEIIEAFDYLLSSPYK
ncbi:MAG: helix-turn-helix domain-containing protein [bacterium]